MSNLNKILKYMLFNITASARKMRNIKNGQVICGNDLLFYNSSYTDYWTLSGGLVIGTIDLLMPLLLLLLSNDSIMPVPQGNSEASNS